MNGHKKRTSLAASSMAAMLSCILLFSCNNEDLFESKKSENTCDNICFGITPREKAQTRGDVGGNEVGYTSERFVLRSEESTDTLCMRAVVSEGINSSALDSKRVITRGVPVTSDNFDAFHVVAYWKKNNNLQSQFYMDVDATKKGNNLWSSEQTYYWPGAGNTLQFVAWAPAEIFSPSATDQALSYTVPEEAANQQDIVVAKTEGIGGDYNKEVPLTFQHICTAVRFVVGSQMQPGTIKSVALKGVKNAGIYKWNVIPSTWELNKTSTDDFSQVLEKTMTGSETDGTEVTTDGGTFMMLPQTLPADAKVEVVFINANNVERTLTASIGGATWEMGTTVTYKLSITPEYELEFLDVPTVVDAHYSIIPIKISAKDVKGSWKIESTKDWVTVKSALTSYERDGYWLKATGDYSAYCESEKVAVDRNKTLDKSDNGDVELFLFVSENDSIEDRTVTLTLSKDGTKTASIDVIQKCPNWQGNFGWEVLEENILLPYGFKWDREVTLQKKLTGTALLKSLEEWWTKQIFKKQPSNLLEWIISLSKPKMVDYVNISRNGDVMTVIIDYTKITNVTSAISTTDGLTNTWNLYSHVDGTSFDGEQNLINNGYTIIKEIGSNEDTKSFAALYAIKLNAFDVNKASGGGKDAYSIIPSQTDINWYLPASGQFTDNKAGLSGQYWSSTAIDDNINAYSWNTSSQSTPRMEFHKVRAVRKKP